MGDKNKEQRDNARKVFQQSYKTAKTASFKQWLVDIYYSILKREKNETKKDN